MGVLVRAAERFAAQPRAALLMLPLPTSTCPPLIGCSGLLGPTREISDLPAAKSHNMNARSVEVPRLAVGGVGDDFEPRTTLELLVEVGARANPRPSRHRCTQLGE
jgi:hypothetical protein